MILNMTGPATGGSAISAPIIGKDFNWTGGDGTYQVLDDGSGNWRIKFLSSGTFTPLRNMVIDAFLVGGGGPGGKRTGTGGAAGGGSGYTTTVRSIVLAANTAGGKGQGTTTREFGEANGDLYASGGGDNLTATVPNSGNGGAYHVEPADGIVVIRQHKEVAV